MDAPVVQIDDLVEEESASRGAREACAYQLSSVGEVSVAGRAGEQSCAADMFEKYYSHRRRWQQKKEQNSSEV